MAEKFDEYLKVVGGIGEEAGGDSVSIAGSGVIRGGVYESVKASGSIKVKGSLRAKEFKVAGAAKVEGDLEADLVKASGSISVDGALRGGVVKTAGAINVKGVLNGREIGIAGGLKAYEVVGDVIRIGGAFKVKGAIKGNYVSLTLSGDSEASSIEAEELYIKTEKKKFAMKFAIFEFSLNITRYRVAKRPILRVGRIKAKKLYVKGVIIKGDVEAEDIVIEDDGKIEGRVTRTQGN